MRLVAASIAVAGTHGKTTTTSLVASVLAEGGLEDDRKEVRLRIVALAETPLGFRHGPKTIVNGNTLVVMFLSNDPHARRYELDLLRELRADGVASRILALHSAGGDADAVLADAVLADAVLADTAPADAGMSDDLVVPGALAASDLALCFPYAVFAQTFAFLQSLTLGLRPDTPNARGGVNRVVQGVSVYPWHPAR